MNAIGVQLSLNGNDNLIEYRGDWIIIDFN